MRRPLCALCFRRFILKSPGETEKIAAIRKAMHDYIDNGILQNLGEGFVFTRRSVGGNTRSGLVVALDLECYDYSKGSTTLIRATEGTIVERIPPRLKIRDGALLELPHILVLIDDERKPLSNPLRKSFRTLKSSTISTLCRTADTLKAGSSTMKA